MREITRRAALGLLAAPALVGRARAQATRLRLAHPHPDSDSWNRAARLFAARVAERSGGALQVQVFGNGALGSDPTTIAAARGGTLDIVLTGNPFFTGLAPKLNVLDLPFLFRERRHVAAVLDGPIGRQLLGELEGANLHVLGFWDIGFRNVTNSRRPVAVPADLRGLKIRTTPNPAHIKAFQLLGANPAPMPFTELFTALETRTVDGQENPTTLILNARFYEVQRHLSLTRHAYTAGILAMSKARWESLPEPQREAVAAAAEEVTPQQRQMNEDAEASSVAELKAKGMQVVEAPDRAAFAAIVAEEVRRDFASRFGAELPEAIAGAGA
ncbi:TRAP transporter substrate-binding protein [Roseicella aquatilis]|uniref:TRAP transporter substrate-binding protein n=1 Tax=Roseicella aquatilis TaxID=2527868 RepID=A0A4R4D9Y3_9PROT|nr:TRAP transporter substrate-binding protein [Roseicella aquatilis]TCZ56632.1 TRAP transporter substrate-binding protein [Roseicella aquatilis]